MRGRIGYSVRPLIKQGTEDTFTLIRLDKCYTYGILILGIRKVYHERSKTMKTIKATGEQVAETRTELAQKYFDTFGDGITSVYAKGNMGIVTLLSDLQEVIGMSNVSSREHYRQILNDIKCILISDDRKGE